MTAARRTRILIVDDSAVMRSLLRSVVCSDPGLEAAGTAADGASALATLAQLQPDLILLDVEVPVMDGLITLRELRRRGNKMPVIMCSSLTQRGARVTIEALAGGASDYVAKPSGQSGREAATAALAQELLPKIHALTRPAQPRPPQPPPALSAMHAPLPGQQAPARPVLASAPLLVPAPPRPQPISATPSVIVIGVSTGGPAALDVLLPGFPAAFPLPVLIVQHMPELFTRLIADRLDGRCHLRVREAAEGDAVAPGTIFIARGNWHMEVLASSRSSAPPTLHLNQGPQENHCRPAVDVLFRTAAKVFGPGVLAAVLTGMGSDGLSGSRIIREQGGSVLAQDEASSTVWGMPGAVATAGLAQRILPLDAIAPEILRIASHSRPLAGAFARQAVS
jgi:two-component system chemotaxis response regulator CheB